LRGRTSETGLVAPLALLALGALIVFVSSLITFSRQVDASARHREQMLVARGVQSGIAELERGLVGGILWDDAVAHLDPKVDAVWADANITTFFRQSAPFERIVILDGADRPAYASQNGERAPLSVYEPFRLGAQLLVEEVRAAERARGPIRLGPEGPSDRAVASPIQRTRAVVTEGALYLVTASVIQPDFGFTLPSERAPVAVTMLRWTPGTLGLARRFMLSDLKAGPVERPPPGAARVELPVFGRGPIVLAWTPQSPGAELLRRAVAPIAGVILAFGAIGIVMVVRARSAAAGLLASHRAQSEFLANMSHEIRTPLNGVAAIASALSRTALSPRQAEMVRIIASSAGTLERLLSDVLDLSRIETGAVEIEHEPFHLADAVRAVTALASARAEEKGLALRLSLDPRAEVEVLGDSVRLKQVLTNLVSNAVKFTETGHVQVTLEEAGELDGAAYWRISVEDTGVGFDPAQKARLFDRFQQADGSVTRRFGGSGLGLAISRQLVLLMGGEIDAASRLGEGSTFTLRLPLPRAPARLLGPPAPPPEPDPLQRPVRILMADDHPTNRRVVELLLSELSVELVSAENGREACELYAAHPFDLVLMDMQMPVMDGLTAVARIREHEAAQGLPRTPVVMLTANALPEHQAASLAAGADMHMPKPIQAHRLFAVLQALATQAEAQTAPPCHIGAA
jgi:signal transduction histidine kinase/CheY-like chemotaxis protein